MRSIIANNIVIRNGKIVIIFLIIYDFYKIIYILEHRCKLCVVRHQLIIYELKKHSGVSKFVL